MVQVGRTWIRGQTCGGEPTGWRAEIKRRNGFESGGRSKQVRCWGRRELGAENISHGKKERVGTKIHDLQSRSTSPTTTWGIAAFKVIVISALWGGDGVRPVWREDIMIQVNRVMSV